MWPIGFLRNFTLIGLLLLLSACGGSGSNDKEKTTLDTTPPVITLNGEASMTLFQGEAYIEQGATATDNKDGNVAVVITGNVDVNIVGDYQLTYTAIDSSNNTHIIGRKITIVMLPDTIAPVITLNGGSMITLG